MDTYRAVVDKREQRAYRSWPRSPGPAPAPRWSSCWSRPETHAFDAGRCAQSLMLAAWKDGIGSCPGHLPEAAVATLLGRPSDLSVNRAIGFGYVDAERAGPAASVARRRRPLTELVHWNRW